MKYTLFAVIFLLTSCRTIERLNTRSDSTTTSQTQNRERSDWEVITEYVHDTVFRNVPFADVRVVEVPKYHIIKQTVRGSNEKESLAQDEKTVSVQTDSTEKDYSGEIKIALLILSIAAFFFSVCCVLVAWHFYRPKKPG